MDKKEYIEKNLNDIFQLWLYRVTAWGAALFILFCVSDYMVTPENFHTFIYYRVIIASALLLISYLTKKFTDRYVHEILAFIAVIGSALTLELMILRFGGHTSAYYVGMILIVICALGFIPARFYVHVASAIIIYAIYIVPIVFIEEISDSQAFFIANFFMITIFVTALLLRYLSLKGLINELSLKYELEQNQMQLEELLSDRSRALERTEMEKAKTEAIITAIGDGISIQDTNFKILYQNQVHKNIIGDHIGEYCYQAYEQRDSFCDGCPVARSFEDGQIHRARRNTSVKGKEIHVEVTASPLKDARGNITAGIEVVRDITDRNRAETELKKEKDRAQKYLDVAGVMLLALDREQKVTLINKRGCEILQCDVDNVIGKNWFDTFIPERNREKVKTVFAKLVAGEIEPVEYFENPVLTQDGDERIIAWHNSLLRDEDNKITGTLSSGEDATERKKIEEELLKARKLESLGVLSGGLAHDFNNLLTAILGNISLAKTFADSPNKLKERLDEAEKASLRTRDLTHQLLTFSKGGAPIKKTASIGELIKESVRFALRGSNVKCDYEIPEDLWTVEVDEGQMNQVVNNLIINADQAMPQGGTIRVLCENVPIERQGALPLLKGDYVKITIKDQGIGIPEEHLQKIFDPYFTTKHKGSGLGLATAFSIVRRHGGSITAESQLGEGTAFHLYLPATQEGIAEEEVPDEIPVGGKGKILVMDDEEIVRDVAGVMLTSIGYEVELARDGSEAITLYREALEKEQPFDAVIMDLTIPGGMGGKEAIQKLLEIDPEIKAIVSSGYSNDPIMSHYSEYGFRGIVAKPYKVNELSRTLHEVLTGNDSGPID